MTDTTPLPLVGVLLAGGQARRMGGGDKCLLPLGGRPLLAYLIDRLGPQVDTMVLNINGDASRFASFGLPVVADPFAEHQGPLAGILAGMKWTRVHRPEVAAIVTVATDTPFFPDDLAMRLMAASLGEHVAIARSGERLHRVFGVFPVRLHRDLERFLRATNNRRVGDWLDETGHVVADFDFRAGDCDPFFNINTSADLTRAEAILGAPG